MLAVVFVLFSASCAKNDQVSEAPPDSIAVVELAAETELSPETDLPGATEQLADAIEPEHFLDSTF